jgi:hypothetical protein
MAARFWTSRLVAVAGMLYRAELARIRSPLFYGPAGATAATLTYTFFDVGEMAPFPAGMIGGLAGGLTYWRIVGRSARKSEVDEKAPIN